jgi:hypothetical protein
MTEEGKDARYSEDVQRFWTNNVNYVRKGHMTTYLRGNPTARIG